MRSFAYLVLLSFGCAAGGQISDSPPPGSRGVTQGGAQDIAEFREVVEAGVVPSLDLLDEVGFFAEHALDQPPADCGGAVCAHPMLAVAPRFGPGTWTMGFVSLNSSVDPESRPREPLHVVLAVELSAKVIPVLGAGRSALDALATELTPEDRVSVVAFGNGASIVLESTPASELESLGAALALDLTGPVDLYAGLAAASEAIAREPDMGARVVLLTSGAATGGIDDAARIEELAAAIAREGTSFSVIGLGAEYQSELPSRIADLGVGTYAFAQSTEDLVDILAQEGALRLLPLATDMTLRLIPADGYSVGRIYGVRRARVEGGSAVLEMPALFLGARTGAMDVGMGRRGGGGGLFVELIADAARSEELGAGKPAFTLESSYFDVDREQSVTFTRDVLNELPPSVRPAEDWPNFSEPDYGKAFMMLNMYLALRTTLTLYTAGDCGSALGVGYMMEPAIDEWLRRYPDPDIEADAELLYWIQTNVDSGCFFL